MRGGHLCLVTVVWTLGPWLSRALTLQETDWNCFSGLREHTECFLYTPQMMRSPKEVKPPVSLPEADLIRLAFRGARRLAYRNQTQRFNKARILFHWISNKTLVCNGHLVCMHLNIAYKPFGWLMRVLFIVHKRIGISVHAQCTSFIV